MIKKKKKAHFSEGSTKTVKNCPRWYRGRREVSKHASAICSDFAVSPSLYLGVNTEHKVCSDKMVICLFFWGGGYFLNWDCIALPFNGILLFFWKIHSLCSLNYITYPPRSTWVFFFPLIFKTELNMT